MQRQKWGCQAAYIPGNMKVLAVSSVTGLAISNSLALVWPLMALDGPSLLILVGSQTLSKKAGQQATAISRA